MNNMTLPAQVQHIPKENLLERSRWYGPNLFTFLATAEETNGAFSLLRCTMRQGFEPPRHVHSREEESYYILEGSVIYEAGTQEIHANAGDYVHLPRMVPHRFRLVSETASFLLMITPGGFEKMFREFSRPAGSMELPPVPTGKPDKAFFEAMIRMNEELGVTMLPEL